MPTFDDDNDFKKRVRAIAVQLGDLSEKGSLFTEDVIVGVTVEYVKDDQIHKATFPAAPTIRVAR